MSQTHPHAVAWCSKVPHAQGSCSPHTGHRGGGIQSWASLDFSLTFAIHTHFPPRPGASVSSSVRWVDHGAYICRPLWE